MPRPALLAAVCLITSTLASAQSWNAPVRGSWVQTGAPLAGEVTLISAHTTGRIVLDASAHSAVVQAASFLASDIEKITGVRPVVNNATGPAPCIYLTTLGTRAVPASVNGAGLAGQWEAYQILTDGGNVWLVGSNFRGTAFAAYTLSERLGIDPLYLWTGFTPEHHDPLVMKSTNAFFGPPSFKYRGLFHDDEDILPRPLDAKGRPSQTGTVPTEWYARYFETALRLRFNQVAPYVRVHRPFEVQKMASDWGLYYTSHHYDSLLSNPFGFTRFGLAAERNAGTTWDWFNNRQGMLNYYRGGVLENESLDCIWPVGLRGTEDASYNFPPGMTTEEKGKVYEDVIHEQINMTTAELLPLGKEPIFHFTLYGEMLTNYLNGAFDVPADVMLIWTDDGDGVMRALPTSLGQWKHGVYYHLAFLGGSTKQTHHTVTPARIDGQFRNIVSAGATEYMLLNVSELREFIMEARMIAEICWDATTAFSQPNAADRYVKWWCNEYFGEAAPGRVYQAYQDYYTIIDTYDKISYGQSKVRGALTSLEKKFNGQSWTPANPDTLPTLKSRAGLYSDALLSIGFATARMTPEQRRFFFEHVTYGMLIDYRPTLSAVSLVEAMEEPDLPAAWRMCENALDPLNELEDETLLAEWPPFEQWYRETWIRTDASITNVHYAYGALLNFLNTPHTLVTVTPTPSPTATATPTPTPTASLTPTPTPTVPPQGPETDLNGDGVVDFWDLLLLEADWHKGQN